MFKWQKDTYTYLISRRVVCHRGQLHVLDLDVAPLERGSIDAPRGGLCRSHRDQLCALQHLQRNPETPVNTGTNAS